MWKRIKISKNKMESRRTKELLELRLLAIKVRNIQSDIQKKYPHKVL
mgnify:CR=1 FL=1